MRAPVILGFLLSTAWTAVSRLHTYTEPHEQDISVYAVIAHELLSGRRLYSDLWDHKPPAIHVTYAVAELITGYGVHTVHLLGVGASVAVAVGVWAAARAMTGSSTAGLWAIAFWTLLSGEMDLQGNQPNTEVFINACSTWAIALLIISLMRRRTGRQAVGAGSLFALASLYKPVVVAIPALLCAALVVSSSAGEARRRALIATSISASIGIAAWGGVILYFGATGRLKDFVDAVFTFNRWYGGDVLANLLAGLQPGLLPPAAPALAILGLLSVVGVVAGDRPRMPWLAWAVGTYAAIAAPGHWHPHYYQLWLPCLAVGAAMGVEAIHRRRRHLGLALGTVTVAWLAILVVPEFAVPAETWSRLKYGEGFVTTYRVGALLDRMLLPEETFYIFGNAPGTYFVTRRAPPTGVIYTRPLVEGPLASTLTSRVIQQLSSARPDLVLMTFGSLPAGRPSHPVFDWVASQYRPYRVATDLGPVTLLVRPGSPLERRLAPPTRQ